MQIGFSRTDETKRKLYEDVPYFPLRCPLLSLLKSLSIKYAGDRIAVICYRGWELQRLRFNGARPHFQGGYFTMYPFQHWCRQRSMWLIFPLAILIAFVLGTYSTAAGVLRYASN